MAERPSRQLLPFVKRAILQGKMFSLVEHWCNFAKQKFFLCSVRVVADSMHGEQYYTEREWSCCFSSGTHKVPDFGFSFT